MPFSMILLHDEYHFISGILKKRFPLVCFVAVGQSNWAWVQIHPTCQARGLRLENLDMREVRWDLGKFHMEKLELREWIFSKMVGMLM